MYVVVAYIALPANRPLLAEIWADPVKFSGQTTALQYRRKDGAIICVEQRITPIYDQSGNVVAIQGIARDITERMRAEEERRASQARLDRILETNADGIGLLDLNGRFSLVNAALEKIPGMPRNEIIGRSLSDPTWKAETVAGSTVPAEELVAARVLRAGEQIYGVEYSLERPDGRRIILAVNAGPVRTADGAAVGVVLAVHDITEQKRLDEECEQLVDQLADERRWLPTVIERAPVGITLFQGAR
jgi:PAS domain S-box-containing protein